MPDRPSRARVVFLSNGHGEDVIAAQLAREVRRRRPDLTIAGFPTVTEGAAYRAAGFGVAGPATPLPSGGLTLHGAEHLLTDLRGGLVAITAAQLAALARLRADLLFVVGDVYALLLSALVRPGARVHFQPLVSAWQSDGADGPWNRYFMERIAYPERALMRHLAGRVYLRDERTAAELRERGVRHAAALGNPVVDALRGAPIAALRSDRPVVALLPGTREYAGEALLRMLAALERLSSVRAAVAWAGSSLPEIPGWRTAATGPDRAGARERDAGRVATLERGARRVAIYEGRFADVLASAAAVLGTTGTGTEQAAALGLPVVAFPVEPHLSAAFVRNQKRLLGDALLVAAPDPAAIAASLRSALHDPEVRRAARRAGAARMGGRGGTEAVVTDALGHAVAAGALPPDPAPR